MHCLPAVHDLTTDLGRRVHTQFGLSGAEVVDEVIAFKDKLSRAELDAAREGHSEDAQVEAALRFALQVAQTRGRVSDADLATLRLAGFDEASVIEIVVNVALNVLTNYVNNVARTDIDFPQVSAKLAA